MLPGAGYGGYLKLSELVAKGTLLFNEVLLEYEDGNVFANGKIIQGVHIQEKVVRITGIHYTSWENATQIRSMLRIEPSLQDPFVYISAPGSMTGWAEEEIKKKGIYFETKLGKGVALETINDEAIRTAQLQGTTIALRKDPKKKFVRIKASIPII